MNSRERLEAIFDGELVDRIPFALKGWRIPQCQAERELRNRGMAILDARPVYEVRSPNVRTEKCSYVKDGATYLRTRITTPEGELSTLGRHAGSAKTEVTFFRLEFMFRRPEDYAAITAMYRDRSYEPAYDALLKAQGEIGTDAFFKTQAPGAPLHEIMYNIMGLERFAVEWSERRDEVMKLHDIIAANERPAYDIVAASPARLVGCGGNYSPQVLGKRRFIEFILPHWDEVAEIMHTGDKLLGCHLDADNAAWAEEVGASPLDWIEAFTPSPDSDMSLAEARAAWRGKTLFINFPSSVHLSDEKVIRATTRRLIRESAPGDRFIIGITENVPDSRWRISFRAIMDTLDQFGSLPVDPESV
jgi:hypothetical protein